MKMLPISKVRHGLSSNLLFTLNFIRLMVTAGALLMFSALFNFLNLFIGLFRKPPVKYVFSAISSSSIFVPKNKTYDDTRRSCRNYYVLQGTQSNL